MEGIVPLQLVDVVVRLDVEQGLAPQHLPLEDLPEDVPEAKFEVLEFELAFDLEEEELDILLGVGVNMLIVLLVEGGEVL